jgi:Spy/CpxP family protein refolding chaperone
VLLGAFVLGLICGAALLRIGQHTVLHPVPGAVRGGPGDGPGLAGPPLEHLDRHLDLDGEQRRAVREIVRRQRARLHELLETSRLEIRAVLTPDQQEAFDALRPPDRPRRRPDGSRRGRLGPPPRPPGE